MRSYLRLFGLWGATLACSLLLWAAPGQVWIDGSWTGPAACGGHVWQTDAFATIHEAVAAVAEGGTVSLMPGVYAERVTLDKSLILRGPQAGVNPNAPTAADPFAANPARRDPKNEAILIPPTTDLTFPSGLLVTITGSNITLDGLTLDGHNAALPDGRLVDGVTLNAAGGIGERGGAPQCITITNTVIRHMACHGLVLENHFEHWRPAPSKGVAILNNRFDMIPGVRTSGLDTAGLVANPPPAPVGYAIRLRYDVYALVVGNVITRAAVGISASYYIMERLPLTITDNRIRATITGIDLNNFQTRGGARVDVVVHRNVVELPPPSAQPPQGPYGITLLRVWPHSHITLSDNTITGGAVGVLAWEVWTDDNTILLSGGAIHRARNGVVLTNTCEAGPAVIAQPGTLLVCGVQVDQPGEAGFVVRADPAVPGQPILLLAQGTVIEGGPVGIRISGGQVIFSPTSAPAAVFRNQTQDYVVLTNSGATASPSIDARNVQFQGKRGSEMTPEERAQVQAHIIDATDDPRLGQITF